MSRSRLFAIAVALSALCCCNSTSPRDNRLFDEEANALRSAVRDGDTGAIEELQVLAQGGSPYAQLMLASTYESSDRQEWMKWNLSAAMQGQPVAQINVGGAYSTEHEGEDREKAIFWLRMAADQGKWLGAGLLGDLYRGPRRDKPGDFVQAYRWYTVGARILREEGRKDALKPMLSRRSFVAKSMTPAEIAEAESLAAQWVRKDWGELEARLEELR